MGPKLDSLNSVTIMVPTFNDRNHRVALQTLADLFPGSRGHRDSLPGLGVGTGNAPLHDTAATARLRLGAPACARIQLEILSSATGEMVSSMVLYSSRPPVFAVWNR